MKLPVPAPQITELMEKHAARLTDILVQPITAEVNGQYEHWDKLRHRRPVPYGLSSEEWWLAIKLRRQAVRRKLPLLDKDHKPFGISVTDSMQRLLHFVDREASGSIRGMETSAGQERFLIRSLQEEAMTSSQLEGAATTRKVAKEMLSTGRPPRDRSETMIYNNYLAMNRIREWRGKPITKDAIIELQSIVTDGTLDHPGDAGRLRSAEDNIVIYDRGSPTELHVPPPARELEERLDRLCAFANGGDEDGFVHPVVRAIAIHFQIGYDHPFVDGNGRTARALFYWSMLNSGYWLTEYLSISSVLNKAQGKYLYAYLYTESDGQDLGYFVMQQLEAIEQSVMALHAYIARKQAQDNAARKVLRNARIGDLVLNHRQRALLANAIKDGDRPYTVAGHQAAHTITYPTALNDLNSLVAAGLLLKTRVGKAHEYVAAPDLRERLSD